MAAKATIKQVKNAESPPNVPRGGSYVVLDMNIGPRSHKHGNFEAAREEACRVPSIRRVPKIDRICDICLDKGYVASVQLILFTKSQMVWTALVLAQVPLEELKTGDLRGKR